MHERENLTHENTNKQPNPWFKMAEEVKASKKEETIQERLDKIDISTDNGKYEWLDTRVTDSIEYYENRLKSFDEDDEDSREYEDAQRSLTLAKYQEKFLLNIAGKTYEPLVETIRKEIEKSFNIPPNATDEVKHAMLDYQSAISGLESILYSEMAKRDPAYFGEKEMAETLNAEARAAEDALRQNPDNQELQIDAKCAKKDAETFERIMHEYASDNDWRIPPAIKREDFAKKIDEWIDWHTNEINRVRAKLEKMTKDTPEYDKIDKERRKLVSTRLSAKRLRERFETKA